MLSWKNASVLSSGSRCASRTAIERTTVILPLNIEGASFFVNHRAPNHGVTATKLHSGSYKLAVETCGLDPAVLPSIAANAVDFAFVRPYDRFAIINGASPMCQSQGKVRFLVLGGEQGSVNYL